MGGILKMRDLHNLIDLVEEVSLKKGEYITLRLNTYEKGEISLCVTVWDIVESKSTGKEFMPRFDRRLYINSEWSDPAKSVRAFKDCMEYFQGMLKGAIANV